MALWGIFFTVIPLVLVGGLILAGVGMARKDEYDPLRSYVVYLLSAILVSLVLLVGGATTLVGNIGDRFIGGGDVGILSPGPEFEGGRSFEFHSDEDMFIDRYNTAEAIQAALIAGSALLLLYFHASKLSEITSQGGFRRSVTVRTYNTYLYIVCFATMIAAAIAFAVALYALVRVAAPGSVGTLPGSIEREAAIVDLLQFGVLAGMTAWIFKWHWKAAEALRPGAVG